MFFQASRDLKLEIPWTYHSMGLVPKTRPEELGHISVFLFLVKAFFLILYVVYPPETQMTMENQA